MTTTTTITRWSLKTKLSLFLFFASWLVICLQMLHSQLNEVRADAVSTKEVVASWQAQEIAQEPTPVDNWLVTCAHGEIYRGIKWLCNSNWQAQDMPDLKSRTREERMRELLTYYNKEYLYDTFFQWGKMFWVYPELAICIAKADTTLGRHMKTKNNLGNVGNTDSWKTREFDSEYKAIRAIYQVLTNRNLWHYTELWQLSRKHNKDWLVYATSEENWHNNVTNCMWVIRGETIDEHFPFRF